MSDNQPAIPAEVVEDRPEGVTDKQAMLAELIVLHGMDKSSAITAAGYASKSAGYSALRMGHVQDYVTQLVRTHLLESSIKAARTLEKLMNAKSEYVQLQAAQDVLDRTGHKPVEKHAHMHRGSVSVSIDLGDKE